MKYMRSFLYYFPKYFEENFIEDNTFEIVTAGIKEIDVKVKQRQDYITIQVFDKENDKLIFILQDYYCPNIEKVTYKTENGITKIKIVEKEISKIPVIKEE
ncbi:MAG: hypothetical protein KatS3mg002_1008 [Candidatus Woesearchaeota archaeon]|jgi:hypothetical protein|nr:MAG: hypothetical protein KatS3mg002_1008 [Candidatus Woesearchaeota archaeon]